LGHKFGLEKTSRRGHQISAKGEPWGLLKFTTEEEARKGELGNKGGRRRRQNWFRSKFGAPRVGPLVAEWDNGGMSRDVLRGRTDFRNSPSSGKRPKTDEKPAAWANRETPSNKVISNCKKEIQKASSQMNCKIAGPLDFKVREDSYQYPAIGNEEEKKRMTAKTEIMTENTGPVVHG